MAGKKNGTEWSEMNTWTGHRIQRLWRKGGGGGARCRSNELCCVRGVDRRMKSNTNVRVASVRGKK